MVSVIFSFLLALSFFPFASAHFSRDSPSFISNFHRRHSNLNSTLANPKNSTLPISNNSTSNSTVPFNITSSFSFNGSPPSKIRGVNIGSWLVSEAWMFEKEWASMGGEYCQDCSACARTEWSLTKKLGQAEANKQFENHWATWFTDNDVETLASYNLNTVRIPLGFWIIPSLVDPSTEFFPQGGLSHLVRGLESLQNFGISALLDFHAMPGVSASFTMFSGHCTGDVEFYSEANYKRALTWASIMTILSHTHPSFSNVWGIEAVNEPLSDASKTPEFGGYQRDFVNAIRATEIALGMSNSSKVEKLTEIKVDYSSVTDSLDDLTGHSFEDILGMVGDVLNGTTTGLTLDYSKTLKVATKTPDNLKINRSSLTTTFMDVNFQFNSPPNPADSQNGPIMFDGHEYFAFGNPSNPSETTNLQTVCSRSYYDSDASQNNTPLMVGKWSLATGFEETDDFMPKWADAQKLIYSQGKGWIFWNFKIEKGGNQRHWDYTYGVEKGWFTKDSSKYNDENVCSSFQKRMGKMAKKSKS